MGALPRPDVPAGAVRELSDALHELHHRAGWPSLREMSRDVGYSHTTISAAFSDTRVPRWGLLELIVETLGGDPERFHQLWLAATGAAPSQDGPPRPVGPDAAGPPDAGGPAPNPVPRQLPADVADFTGRTAQLRALDDVLTRSGTAVVSGTAGVGKTALAVHWAHRVADRFPDGQLYLDLRSYDPDIPVAPDEALDTLLRGLGVDRASIPAPRAEKAARYRSTVAGRRVLILLDNAGSLEQVRDLLPGDRCALVLVTSRDTLPALVARYGALRLSLDLFAAADAVDLLRTLVGPRVDAEPAAALALAERTARLPLALRLVAELALSRPDSSLADLVDEFDDEAERLDLLSAGGDEHTAVRAVFSWSTQQLAPEARYAFALVGLHPGPDIDEQAAAALLGSEPRAARRIFEALARAHLVDMRSRGRLSMHDLLRAYARELADELDERERQLAVTRLFDHYLDSATGAGTSWFDAERLNLLAVATAAAGQWPHHVVGLARAMAGYLDAGAYYTDALALDQLAVHAARETGDTAGQAAALNLLGNVHRRFGDYHTAGECHEQALDMHRDLGDRTGEATALHGLGILSWRAGRYAEARTRLQTALGTFREAGDRAGEGQVLYVLGVAEMKLGHYPAAVAHLELGVQVNAEIGKRTNEGRATNNLGEVYLRLGRIEDAAQAYTCALRIARQVGNRAGEGVALCNLATIEHRRGRTDAALAGYAAALAICRDVSYRVGEADVLCGLGAVHRSLGRYEESLASLTSALRIGESVGGAEALTGALLELAQTYAAAGRTADATAHFRQALDISVTSGDRYEQARAHGGLAGVLPDAEQAGAHQRAAQDCLFELGLPNW